MKAFVVAIVAVLAAIVFASCTFVVHEGEAALVIELGKVKRTVRAPGLHAKLPLVEKVQRFDMRIIAWDGDPERIPVKDSKFIFVDTFARWRITDPVRFYNAVRDQQGGQSRLDDILDGSVRDVVSTHYLLELVRTTDRELPDAALSSDASTQESVAALAAMEAPDAAAAPVEIGSAGQRLQIRQQIFDICSRKLRELDLGIELVDLRIRRLDYTEQVSKEVYRRMISEQQRIAERYRAQGQGKRAEIAGLTEQERQRIDSESYRRAQEILGAADAESTRVYAAAYGQDPELYRFLRSLETYESVIGGKDTLLLSTDSDLLKYLKSH